MDGDGLADMIVGAGCDADDLGAAWLVRGRTSWSSSPSDFADLSTFVATGASPGDNCGLVSTLVGDVIGDGLGDIAVGCPYQSARTGAVYLFSGASATGTSTTASAIAARIGSAGEGAGATIVSGDVNGDGFADVAVGNGPDSGAAYLLFGGP